MARVACNLTLASENPRMKGELDRSIRSGDWRRGASTLAGSAGLTVLLAASVQAAEAPAGKVKPGDAPTQEWHHLGGSAAHTRYSPAKQITAENFGTLKTAWVWDGASFRAQSGRSTPTYMDGKLFTVAGERRYVVAIDPGTGETVWSYVEPTTPRYEYSMRKD
jgi:glucose dehydrogenase